MSHFEKQEGTINNTILYSKDTLKRIVSDIKQIKKNPLDSQGVYYEHDDENILVGYALIIGPEDTPYEYGNYFFKLDYPNNYPHSPPKVTFHNWGDNIRFNPNLYRTGKVCLSVLNTWKGEGWTSCQSLSTILLTLCTVLNEYPLLNEPGFTMNQEDAVTKYSKIITYKNIELSFLKCYSMFHEWVPHQFHSFYDNVKENFEKNKTKLYEKVIKYESDLKNGEDKIIASQYNMRVDINYLKIKKDLKEHIK
jgi:ubiquitin-protein ligase